VRKDAVGGGMLWKLWRRAQMKSGTDADLRGSTTVQSQHVYAFPLVLYPPLQALQGFIFAFLWCISSTVLQLFNSRFMS
jgi:hypothetical protein